MDGGAYFRSGSNVRLVPANLVGIVQVFGVGYHFDAVAAFAERGDFAGYS
jgi:hypothetical protein